MEWVQVVGFFGDYRGREVLGVGDFNVAKLNCADDT